MKKYYPVLVAWWVIVLVLLPLPAVGELQIHIIDVGQGASQLIIGPDGTSILIDGGTRNQGTRSVIPYLNSIFPPGARHLDYVIATHDHSDHYGGLLSVFDGGYTAGTIYHCGVNARFGLGDRIPLGLSISLGNGARALCVGRGGEFIDGSRGGTSPNNRSIALLVQYGQFGYLTAGDLESNECLLAEALVEYPPGAPLLCSRFGIDVLHANHHGSDTSSLACYVNRLRQRLAVISGGTNYGHPRWSAVDRLKGRLHYSESGRSTGVNWPLCLGVYRTTWAPEVSGRAPEWDCPTLGDMLITYRKPGIEYFLYGDNFSESYRVEGPFFYTPTPSPTPEGYRTPSPAPAATLPPELQARGANIDSGDYSGDGTDDLAVYRPSTGLWVVRGLTRVYFGGRGDVPVPADYDGGGRTDFAVFRPASGLWAVRGLTRVYFGRSGDQPVPGDYSGSGSAGFGLFRPASGLWAVRGSTRAYFGRSGDIPVPGYYNGDGRKSFGVFRPSSGLWAVPGVTRVYFGSGNDIPVPGDYDGTGRWVPAVFRPAAGLWSVKNLTRFYFGDGRDTSVPGGYAGDGADRGAVFRPASGLWAIREVTRVYFGSESDLPVTR